MGARAATAAELTKLRSSGQWCKLYLAGLEMPRTVFAARINDTFDTNDKVAVVTYDNVTSGAYTDILPGMTIWFGTTSGACDIGQARVRKAATSTELYVGEASELDLADNLYITILDEFLLWPRHVRISSSTAKMDYDIEYSDQHEDFDPVPIMGSDVVVDVSSYPITVSFDGSDSWVFGSSISSKQWTVSAGSLSGSTGWTPTLTISSRPAGGRIRVGLTVTAANGKSFTGYRYVYVYDATHRPAACVLEDCQADYDSGGWSFTVRVMDEEAEIRDRSRVILFAEDYYNGAKASVGPAAGRENIVCAGYVAVETVERDADASQVRFSVEGPQYWMGQMQGFPPGVELAKKEPTAWTAMPNLTVDRALWHLLHWRCNATQVMDVQLTGDTRLASAFLTPAQSLWEQIRSIAGESILAYPGCDRLGRLWVEIEPQVVAESGRSWATVMELTRNDWSEMDLERAIRPAVSLLSMSGVSVKAGGAGKAHFSLSPGHIFAHYGQPEILDNLLLSNQAQSNKLCGLIYGWRNNTYPSFTFSLAQNNRMIDLWPRQYVELSIAEGDTIRGVAYDGRVVPRSISYVHDPESGAMTVDISGEGESFEGLAVTGDFPPDPPDPPFNPWIPYPEIPYPYYPPRVTMPKIVVVAVWDENSPRLIYTVNFDATDGEPVWSAMDEVLQDELSDSYVKDIVKCPSGLLVCSIGAQDEGWAKNVYMAPGVGSGWTRLFEPDPDLDGAQVVAIGVNPNQSEKVAVVTAKGRFYIGDRSGLVYGCTLNDMGDVYNAVIGQISFGNGKWLISADAAGIFDTSSVWEVKEDGSEILTYRTVLSNGNSAATFHRRVGTSSVAYVYGEIGTGGEVWTVTDGVETAARNTVPLPIYLGELAISDTGLYQLIVVDNYSYFSSDYGATWVTKTLRGAARSAVDWWQERGFVIAHDYDGVGGPPQVFFTPDGDSTRYNRSGNFAYIVGAQASLIRKVLVIG